MELISKGIDNCVIDNLLVDNKSDEEAIRNLLKKKVKNIEELDKVKIKKIYAYLYRKGFSPELIRSELNDYISNT